MAQQKKGLIARMLEGKERSDEYARNSLPTSRWQLFFDIFKNNFSKLVKVNLLMLLFFVPMIAVIVVYMLIGDVNSSLFPFGSNLGIGYPVVPNQMGLSERLLLETSYILHIGLFVTSFIAAIGLAGGMYVIRNMVWTEGIFIANDFWRGVKLNIKNALQTALFFSVILFVVRYMINLANLNLAMGGLEKWQTIWLRISQVTSYVFLVVAIMMSLWMIALGVNYQLSFLKLLRNAFLMSVGTLPQTVFFGVIALLPFFISMLGGTLFTAIGVILILVCGFAYALLVWLDFAQWVFDKYINPKLQGAKVGRGIYNKDGSAALTGDDSKATLEYQRIILSHGRSRLVAKPIKPIDDSLQVYELPQAFTREDLKRLRESKQNIAEDTEAYAEEHKNDFRYVEYNRQFDEREKALQESEGKKKKKLKPPKMLNE